MDLECSFDCFFFCVFFLLESDVNENSCSKGKFEEPKVAFKKEGTALDQRLQKATGN